MDNDFKFLIDAGLDDDAKQHVQTDIDKKLKGLKATIEQLNLDPKAAQALQNALQQNGINLNLDVSLNASNIKQAQQKSKQSGELVGKAFQKGFETVTSKGTGKRNFYTIDKKDADNFETAMKKEVNKWTKGKGSFVDVQVQTRSYFDETINKNMERLHQATVTYKNDQDEIIKKTVAWRQIGKDANGEAIMGFAEVRSQYSKTINSSIQEEKRLAKEKQKNQKEQQKLIDSMAKGREKSELSRKKEDKQLEIKQSNAQNRALENEIADREKLAQLMAEGRELAEQERLAKEKASKASVQEQSNKILDKVDSGDYDTIINKQIIDLQKYGYTAEQAESQVFGLTNALRTMASVDSTPEERNAAEQKFQSLLGKTKNVVTEAKNEWQGLVTVQQRLTKANAIEAFLQKNTRITAEAKAELERYVASLRDVDTAMSKVAKNNIDVRFKEIENSMRGLNKLGYALSDQMKQAAGSFAQWISVSNMIMTGIYRTREAVNELIDVDNILTEISKTSDMTKNELIELGNASFESASKLGRTAPDYLNTVMDMSRSGFYGDQAEAMAEQVLLAQTAGDLTQELASNYIISTNAAYKFAGDVSKINEVLSGMNIITNRNSVAMQDMAEAMSVAGTVASSYRINPDEFAAIVGTIESVTKIGGNEVGNAAKALFINLQNITSSKIVGTLERAGASMTEIVDGVEKLRTPVEILRDLSETFNDLDADDPLRAEILTNIGQKYHATKLAALLENFDMYDKMLQDYSEGFGSAEEEAAKSASNVTGSLNKLSNNWTDIINNMLSSDTMLFGINTLNELLTLINGTTDALGEFGSVGMIGTAIASAKGYGLNHSLQPLFIRLHIMPCN